jgi:hypothetical protein
LLFLLHYFGALPVPTGAMLVMMQCGGANILAVLVVGLLVCPSKGARYGYDAVFDGFMGHMGSSKKGLAECTGVTRSHSVKFV